MKFLIYNLCLVFSLGLWAQESVYLNLDTLLNKVESNNLKLQISAAKTIAAKSEYQQSNAVFLPNISANYSIISTTNPLMAFGSKLNQEILTQNDFNPALLNDPDRIENFSTTISVEQGLLNFDKFAERKAAKYAYLAQQFQGERLKQALRLEAKTTFMQLQLAYTSRDVMKKALKTAEAYLRQITNFYDEGLVQKADVLAVNIRVNDLETKLDQAEASIKNISDQLAFLMQDNSEVIYIPNSDLNLKLHQSNHQNSLESRADLQAINLGVKAQEQLLKSNQLNYLPRLNAFGNLQLFDDEFLQADAQGYLVGVQLKWDIFKGYQRIAKTKTEKAKLNVAKLEAKAYQDEAQIEIKSTKRQLNNLSKAITTAQVSVNQAKEALRIIEDRFNEGLEKSSDVLAAQSKVELQELKYFQTIFNYNYTSYYLNFLTNN
ncbi:TolC family protein [Psychroflexus sp. ALD_RP9]|uniref:TolC family protein n=1 Tax=Psychroflexus sp. ALD_RP9 TaxID=2777186 RepID=UPI001A906BD9|nr:TolC family protein [Psychroflexus sp. ALD_RP9]QSS97873.1 TolC family protein [Psychroflexus sp. ALD_RP9]